MKTIEVAGFPIEVGVLRDGTPFLSGRGLARACGISNSTLVGWGELTPQAGDRHRAGKMADLLATYGYQGDRFFFRLENSIKLRGKAVVSAYPYQVCMAFLDYYAFEANKEEARNSLRILSEKQLMRFIYEAMGYTPPTAVLAPVHPVQTPPTVDTTPVKVNPKDYFGLEQAISRGKLRSLLAGLPYDSAIATYLNLEKAWSRYWHIQKLGEQYGRRVPRPRQDEYDVSLLLLNGTMKTYLYPVSALSEFKRWLNWHYIPERFPSYLQRKMKQVVVPVMPMGKLLPVS
jgi:hypothetical protein